MKVVLCVCAALAARAVSADQPTSYMPVDIKEDFATTMKRMEAAKPAIEQRQQQLLVERYDLSNHPASGVGMSAIQIGKAFGARVSLDGRLVERVDLCGLGDAVGAGDVSRPSPPPRGCGP